MRNVSLGEPVLVRVDDLIAKLQFDVVEFSPRFADSVDNALMRLRSNGELLPPHVRFHDRPELEEKWRSGQQR